MPFLDELAARIQAEGAGTLGLDLFLSTKATLPTGAGPYTTLTETGGTKSLKTHDNKPIQRPSAHIVIRATQYPDARTRAAQVYAALGGDTGLFNTSLSGTFYLSIIPVQQLYDLGLDELQRARVAFNIDVEKQPS